MVRTRTSMATPPAARALRVLVAAAVAVALLGLPAIAAAHDGFTDVSDGGVHSDAVHTLDHDGIFDGTLCDNDLFCPGEPLTRAHMAVWLVRVLDDTDPATVDETRFSDVAGGHPHAAFIERFAELGVTLGCASGPLRYCPDDHVTRAQMASFLVRAFDLTAGEAAGFVDVGTGGVHRAAIDALAATRITFGCATDPLRYCPRGDVTRAQMASFLVRAQQYATERDAIGPEPPRAPDVLPRCTTSYGAGRVRVLAGTTGGGYYDLVAAGEPDACERIKSWFTQALNNERRKAEEGHYPCEYDGPDDIWIAGDLNPDPAVLVGCWPTVLPDPQTRAQIAEGIALGESRAEALAVAQRASTLPPNSRAMIEALWNCYHDALAGPPDGWQGNIDQWPTVSFCNAGLSNFGNPVRNLGVSPGCAASRYSSRTDEFKEHGTDLAETLPGISRPVSVYAGAFSWVGCETRADRLLGANPGVGAGAPFAERCAAIIDAAAQAAQSAAAAAAAVYSLSMGDYIDAMKDMFCAGTAAGLKAHPEFHGPWAADALPPEGSVCFEKALLNAAAQAVYDEPVTVKLC